MSEVYSLGERLVIISVLYICSLIISLIYLCYRVDKKEISCIIFFLCLIYFSFFVFLNLIAVVDLIFTNEKGFDKLYKFIIKFYLVFTIVDKALGFVLFNILIYYLESGYNSICKKLSDIAIRKFYSFKKKSCCEIIVILSINVSLISVLLAFLVIYREHFDLNNPLDYLNVLLDCYSIFEIYTYVGFFLFQSIIDYRLRIKPELAKDIKIIQ